MADRGDAFSPSYQLTSVRFLTFTAEEIKQMSCKRITNPETFDSLLHPNPGGLHDPALGPCDKQELCGTCGLNYIHCPGHVGHIILPLVVFHPIFFQTLYSILRGSCFVCGGFLSSPYRTQLLKGQIALLERGLVSDALELEYNISSEPSSNETADGKVDDGTIAERTHSHVQSCLAREPGRYDTPDKSRHLTELRQHFIEEFFHSLSTTRCSRCSAPVRKIRHEFQTKVMIRSLSQKLSLAWKAAANKEDSAHPHTTQEGYDTNHLLDCPTEQHFLTPLEAREHLRTLWRDDSLLMKSLFSCLKNQSKAKGVWSEGVCSVDMFFVDVVVVPPSRFRPISSVSARKYENSQTTNLQRILKWCEEIDSILAERNMTEEELRARDRPLRRQTPTERLQYTWSMLQTDINSFMDSDIRKSRDTPNGIKQIMEKKEGLFRKHMMGKRVNYAARSVISPDPNINMDQIGIPLVFASKLTYPEAVTHWNVQELRQAVINGPNVHPGATHVQNEDGSLILLSGRNSDQRRGIAKRLLAPDRLTLTPGRGSKSVHRHLRNGDILLLNRQPTLHRPSIMAMKARVLPGEKTLRLHYANCKAFNADFDGDEMNAHFPQNELARSEAYNLVSTHYQYLVPKDGTPLSGLIQDHIVSGLLLTMRGRVFSRPDYQQLLFAALPNFGGFFKLLPPCIMRPQQLWSGKQVVSTLLINLIPEGQKQLNMVSKTKINPKSWNGKNEPGSGRYHDDMMSESEVIFREGNLLSGILDKSQLGASQYGFIHSCHELYGGAVTNELLSAIGRVCTRFLQLHGFSLGVEDILVTGRANRERQKIMRQGRKKGCGLEAAAEAFGVANPQDSASVIQEYRDTHHHSSNNGGLKILDYCVKKRTDQLNNSINTVCVPAGLLKPFPYNTLQLMVQAGAKGSTVNCMQISCLLGQIELEGQRPPIMLSGKSLPSFLAYDTSPRAGGFIDGRFLTGIRPQEYFFHCMAGREGLIDTAVKTSRSGYLQRCLIKHLEGLTTKYDMTVRDSDGSVMQFLYGEDGMDVGKTRYLNTKQLSFLKDNYQALLYQLDPKSSMFALDSDQAAKYQRKVDRWEKKQSKLGSGRSRRSGFLDFYKHHLPEVRAELTRDKPRPESNHRTKSELKVIDMWYNNVSPMYRESVNRKCSRRYDPAVSVLRPDRYFGSIPEKINGEINAYLKEAMSTQSATPISVSGDRLKSLIQFKCLRALCDPGEAVGLLAAQSIGEPSTQMTLNTFHFAGRGEMNVTLGIPRLREILMTASPNIKTPAMEVPLLAGSKGEEDGVRLKKLFTRVLLKDVLDKCEVWESMGREGVGFRHRLYRVKLSFLKHHYYKDEYELTPKDVLDYVESVFVKKLIAAILKEMKIIQNKRMNSVGVVVDIDDPPTKESAGDLDESQAPPPDDDDDETDVSDIDMEEPDAGNQRMKNKKRQQVSYDSSDNESVSDKEEGPGDNDSIAADTDIDIGGEMVGTKKRTKNRKKDIEDVPLAPNPASWGLGMDGARAKSVQQLSSHVMEYVYDPQEELWCQVTLKFPCVDFKVMVSSLIEKLASKVTIREVPHIKRGFLSGDKGAWLLKTEGVNLQELWKYSDVLDLKKAYTNNIYSIATTYGIEAANRAIIKEVTSVFGVYGIQVDYRHLALVADYMTYDGVYKAFNRYGMEASSSPLQQMSFETTMKFLKAATIHGDEDRLLSPSACLVAGRLVDGGTGCVTLL